MSIKSVHINCENIDSPLWLNNSNFSYGQTLDLWKISIKDLLPEIDRLKKFLSEEEKRRVERYHQNKDKIRFTIGRGMLRFILAGYLNVFPSSLNFKKGLYNKPIVEQPDFHFNASYAEDLIIIGVANEAIGVDIEYINRTLNYKELAEEVFTQKEKSLVCSSSKGREEFFKIWTRKEALLKAVSRGLGDDLKNFSCLDGLQPGNGLAFLDNDWRIQSFILDKQYYVSMAFQQTTSIRYFNSYSILPDR
jgi:4'-phosphopantetheinyl transferase